MLFSRKEQMTDILALLEEGGPAAALAFLRPKSSTKKTAAAKKEANTKNQ